MPACLTNLSLLRELLAACWQIIEQIAPFMLLGFLMAGIVSQLLPAAVVARQLGGRGWWPVVKAALFGVPVALCSCGVLPVAATLRKSGASRGATISFLISSPETGLDSLLVTWGVLGWAFALFRMAVALINGIVGGLLVSLLGGPEAPDPPPAAAAAVDGAACCHSCEHCAPSSAAATLPDAPLPARPRTVQARLAAGLHFGFVELPRDLAGPLLLGLVAAAVLTIATQWLLPLLHGVGTVGGIALAIVLGMPLYICSTASVPVAASLIYNVGLTPGAALAFLIVGPATNAACVTTLWRLFGPRTTGVYLASVAGTAFGAGLLFDKVFALPGHTACGWCAVGLPPWLLHSTGIALCALLVWPLLQRALRRAPVGGAGAACSHCGAPPSACTCAH